MLLEGNLLVVHEVAHVQKTALVYSSLKFIHHNKQELLQLRQYLGEVVLIQIAFLTYEFFYVLPHLVRNSHVLCHVSD